MKSPIDRELVVTASTKSPLLITLIVTLLTVALVWSNFRIC
jgi:hypothetical protein